MPKETFYNPNCTTPAPHTEVRGDAVAISWGSDHPGVQMAGFQVDRSAINRMIRVLRKARDQAFGSDE